MIYKADMSSALFVNKFEMKGVIATDENSNTVCYPIGTTERRLKALIEALGEKKSVLSELKFTYPITLDSLQKDRTEIYNMINDRSIFNDIEYNDIFKKR